MQIGDDRDDGVHIMVTDSDWMDARVNAI